MKVILLAASWLILASPGPTAQGANADGSGTGTKPTEWLFDCEVVTPAGKPVAGADVFVTMERNRSSCLDQPVIAAARTDATGHYRSSYPVPPHWVSFTFFIFAHAKEGSGIGWLHGELRRKTSGVSKVVLQPTGTLKLRILNPDGAPAAGLLVWVAGCSMEKKKGNEWTLYGFPPQLPGSLWKATTDADGRCEIFSLPKGGYVYLNHGQRGYAQFTGKHGILVEGPKVDGSESALTLARPGSIRGRVVLPDKTPVPGAIVSIIEKSPYVTAHGDAVRTDAEGRFSIDQIPASAYHLHFEVEPPFRDEWIGAEKQGIAVKAGDTIDVGDLQPSKVAIVTARVLNKETSEPAEDPITFRLAAGKHELRYRSVRYPSEGWQPPAPNDFIPVEVAAGERKTIDFKLAPVKPGEVITGVVLDENGKPAAGASFIMMASGSHEYRFPEKTDSAGRFRFICPREATGFLVTAWDENNAMSDLIPVKRGEAVTVKLRQVGFASVKGRVLDEDGHPVGGAHISWFGPGASGHGLVSDSAESDSEGRFSFPRFWGGDDIIFFCKAKGFGGAALRDTKVEEGKLTELKIILKHPNQALSGIVVDAAGKPVSGLNVKASGDDQPGDLVAKTNAEGRFHFDKLCAGDVHLSVRQKTEDFSTEAGKWVKTGAKDVRLVLPAAKGEVAGIVVNEAGEPLADAKVETYERDRKTVTGKDGRFKISGIASGWFTVKVRANDPANGPREKELRLKSGMKDLRITVPDHMPQPREYSIKPLDLIGRLAADIHVAVWINSNPLTARAGGKVRILDFWGLQCAPCLAGFPKVQDFWAKHRDHNIEVIAATGFYPEQEVREFLQEHPTYQFPVALQTEDSTSHYDYDVRGVPVYVVIDQAGKIVSSGHDWHDATEAALKLLPGRGND